MRFGGFGRTKLKSTSESGGNSLRERDEVSKGNPPELPLVWETYGTFCSPIQEGEGACRLMGGQEAGRPKARLWRAEVPRADSHRQNYQEGYPEVKVQGM